MFISIHVPSWGTTEEAIDIDNDEEISIHVPSWGTTVPGKTVQLVYDQFQSTFPRGERPIPYVASVTNIEFQSTFPRGERPRRISLSGSIYRISIHVPSWGTTYLYISLYIYSHISIHVPSWGTTQTVRIRAPVKHISIHVPSWGTTFCRNRRYKKLYISIHVPSWGTTALGVTTVTTFLFQSTFPRGERR